MILLIDNYDSFTYNVYQLLAELGREVTVVRNDATTVDAIAAAGYEAIVISPGPGEPAEAGITKGVIARMAGKTPILGICLGHQAIGEAFGGNVIRAPQLMHGKTSEISHDGSGSYRGLPKRLTVGRYHSLIIDRATLPECFTVTAQTDDGIIMGIRHRRYQLEGMQFHPESILTPRGRQLMDNFCKSI